MILLPPRSASQLTAQVGPRAASQLFALLPWMISIALAVAADVHIGVVLVGYLFFACALAPVWWWLRSRMRNLEPWTGEHRFTIGDESLVETGPGVTQEVRWDSVTDVEFDGTRCFVWVGSFVVMVPLRGLAAGKRTQIVDSIRAHVAAARENASA